MDYRITKYNPLYRDSEGRYLKDEWTDFSCVGYVFNGEKLTFEDYVYVEQEYIRCILEIINLLKIDVSKLKIVGIEKYEKCEWKNGFLKDKNLELLLQDCLRRRIWCKIIGKKFQIHFGYDYYMYILCELPYDVVNKICIANNLFCEVFQSPYT